MQNSASIFAICIAICIRPRVNEAWGLRRFCDAEAMQKRYRSDADQEVTNCIAICIDFDAEAAMQTRPQSASLPSASRSASISMQKQRCRAAMQKRNRPRCRCAAEREKKSFSTGLELLSETQTGLNHSATPTLIFVKIDLSPHFHTADLFFRCNTV